MLVKGEIEAMMNDVIENDSKKPDKLFHHFEILKLGTNCRKIFGKDPKIYAELLSQQCAVIQRT